jgi:hypothetical protein
MEPCRDLKTGTNITHKADAVVFAVGITGALSLSRCSCASPPVLVHMHERAEDANSSDCPE